MATLAAGVLGAVLVKWGADVIETDNLFKVSMGSMVKEAEAWAAGISKQLRLNQNDVKQYLGTFNVMLTSLGLATDAAYDMSKGLVQLAYDMASFYNLKPEEASTIVAIVNDTVVIERQGAVDAATIESCTQA